MSSLCTHMDLVQKVIPSTQGCEECLKLGESWRALRICLICGYVGCCDGSPHQHAKRHFEETGHPLVQSFEPGENWLWCYVDEIMLQPRNRR